MTTTNAAIVEFNGKSYDMLKPEDRKAYTATQSAWVAEMAIKPELIDNLIEIGLTEEQANIVFNNRDTLHAKKESATGALRMTPQIRSVVFDALYAALGIQNPGFDQKLLKSVIESDRLEFKILAGAQISADDKMAATRSSFVEATDDEALADIIFESEDSLESVLNALMTPAQRAGKQRLARDQAIIAATKRADWAKASGLPVSAFDGITTADGFRKVVKDAGLPPVDETAMARNSLLNRTTTWAAMAKRAAWSHVTGLSVEAFGEAYRVEELRKIAKSCGVEEVDETDINALSDVNYAILAAIKYAVDSQPVYNSKGYVSMKELFETQSQFEEAISDYPDAGSLKKYADFN